MKGKCFLAVLCVLLSLAGVLSILVPSFGRQRLSYAESHAPVGTPPLPLSTYFGGPVMAGNVNVYAIFWFPGYQGDEGSYISTITQYYKDVSGNRLYNMLSEYSSKNGTPSTTTLAGTWVDTSHSYPTLVSVPDIVQEVKVAISANSNWPVGGYDNYFPVYTLPTANMDPSMGGGAHFSFGPQDNPTIYGYVIYCSTGMCSVPTHPNAPNGYAIDGAVNISAHEQLEATTDPGAIMAAGWAHGEIGDVCSKLFGPTPYPYDNGQANQQWLNLQQTPDPYIIQEFGSDSPRGCVLGNS